MNGLALKDNLLAAEMYDTPMFSAAGRGRILGKAALGQQRTENSSYFINPRVSAA